MDDVIFRVGMEIIIDEEKDAINYEKHNYSLGCAKDIVNSITLFGSEMMIVSDGYTENGETRYMMIAQYSGDIVFVAFTWRDDTMRVISLRSASKKEREIFEKQT